MFGHGKHHKCALCSVAKSVGLMSECKDAECADSSHKRGEELDEEDVQEEVSNA